MAEFRNIHTRIWADAWFSELKPDEKLLFVYLFSNPNASVCGMYEMPKRNMALDTGLPVDRVSQILDTFTVSGKVFYENGIVWVVNLKKYNDSGDNVKVQVRVKKDIAAITDCALKRFYCEHEKIPYSKTQIGYPEKKSETETDGKETETDGDGDRIPPPPFVNVYKTYESEIGPLTPLISEELDDAEKTYPVEWVVEAMQESARVNKRSWKYALAILTRWKAEGRGPKSNGKPKPEYHGQIVLSDGKVVDV
jgi:DnaD/phage-associated family protein